MVQGYVSIVSIDYNKNEDYNDLGCINLDNNKERRGNGRFGRTAGRRAACRNGV